MESKNKIFTETIGTSSIAKTMRNSLVPTESTKRNIEKNGIIIVVFSLLVTDHQL